MAGWGGPINSTQPLSKVNVGPIFYHVIGRTTGPQTFGSLFFQQKTFGSLLIINTQTFM